MESEPIPNPTDAELDDRGANTKPVAVSETRFDVTQADAELVARLRKPTDADHIYDWVVRKRRETKSDLPRIGFVNAVELLDEERAEAADRIEQLSAEIARLRAKLEMSMPITGEHPLRPKSGSASAKP